MSKKKGNILIVDDDATIVTRLRARLEVLNYTVLVAKSHNSAIKQLEDADNNVKMVVVDLALRLTDEDDKSIEFLGTQVIDFAKDRNHKIKTVGLSYVESRFAKTITSRMDAFVQKRSDYLGEVIGIIEHIFEFGAIKPRIFIGSSVEGKPIADGIHSNLRHKFECTVWDQDVFKLSDYTLESLLEILDKVHYSILVFSADDVTRIRKSQYVAARDNVVFELGLSISRLGRKNVFYVIPDATPTLRIPTDLLGLTPGRYESRSDKNWVAATGTFCSHIIRQLV